MSFRINPKNSYLNFPVIREMSKKLATRYSVLAANPAAVARLAGKSSLVFSTYFFVRNKLEEGNGPLPPILKIGNGFTAGSIAGTLAKIVSDPRILISRAVSFHTAREFVIGGAVGATFEAVRLVAQKKAQ